MMQAVNDRPGRGAAWLRRSLAALLAAFGVAASAAGWIAVLKDTAAESFQEDDLRLFLDTAMKTLDADGARETADWSNAASGAGGSFRVVGDAPARAGMPCRRLRVMVYAPKYPKSTSTWTMCRNAQGRWQLAGVG